MEQATGRVERQEDEMAKEDPLERQWCCFGCNTTFPMGRMKPHPTIYALRCPNCDGINTHPAHGETIVLHEYQGEIGTKN